MATTWPVDALVLFLLCFIVTSSAAPLHSNDEAVEALLQPLSEGSVQKKTTKAEEEDRREVAQVEESGFEKKRDENKGFVASSAA